MLQRPGRGKSTAADAQTALIWPRALKRETSALLRVLPEEWSHIAATFDGKSIVTYCNGTSVRRLVGAHDDTLQRAGATSAP